MSQASLINKAGSFLLKLTVAGQKQLKEGATLSLNKHSVVDKTITVIHTHQARSLPFYILPCK